MVADCCSDKLAVVCVVRYGDTRGAIGFILAASYLGHMKIWSDEQLVALMLWVLQRIFATSVLLRPFGPSSWCLPFFINPIGLQKSDR